MEPNETAAQKKILIVENDTVISHILAHTLTQNNFTVFEARDGVEGIETTLRESPDLILLDIDMPKMDGMTMLDRKSTRLNSSHIQKSRMPSSA